MDARHLNLIPAFADRDRGDTYSVTYGRATGRVAVGATLLAEAVKSYRDVVKLSRNRGNRGNTPEWRAAKRRHHDIARRYAALTGLTLQQVAKKVTGINGCLPPA